MRKPSLCEKFSSQTSKPIYFSLFLFSIINSFKTFEMSYFRSVRVNGKIKKNKRIRLNAKLVKAVCLIRKNSPYSFHVKIIHTSDLYSCGIV